MEFELTAYVQITCESLPGSAGSRLLSTNFCLDISDNLDRGVYMDEDTLPTATGSESLTSVLIQGLVGNIHLAHEKGWRDSAEHLRFIISELERGFTIAGGTIDVVDRSILNKHK